MKRDLIRTHYDGRTKRLTASIHKCVNDHNPLLEGCVSFELWHESMGDYVTRSSDLESLEEQYFALLLSDDLVNAKIKSSYERGARDMRERCVKVLKQHSCFKGEYYGPKGTDIEDVIAALPLREGE